MEILVALKNKALRNEDVTSETRIITDWWSDDPQKCLKSGVTFFREGMHMQLEEMLISKNVRMIDASLRILDVMMGTAPNNDLRIYFSTDRDCVDILVRQAGKEGQRKCNVLDSNWTAEMLALEAIDSLAEVYEARRLFVPRIPEMLQAFDGVPHSRSIATAKFSLYMAIAKLIGGSDRPEDLDVVNKKDVIDDVIHAFRNGFNRHDPSDSRSLMHTAPAIRALANNENLRRTLVNCGISKPCARNWTATQ